MSSPSGQDSFFYTPAQPASPAVPAPGRVGYGATPPSSPPSPSGRSLTWLLAVAGGALAVIAIVVGFVVLAHKDKHTEGSTVLAPLQSAGKAQLDSDLQVAASAEQSYLAEHGSYTTDLTAAGYASNGSAQIQVLSATDTDFCLVARNSHAAAPEYDSKSGGVSATPCH
ncbi:MAG: hypothetical protein ACJ735_17845 [Actinomycetes bacterium]